MTGPPVSRALLTLGLLLSVTWNSAGAHKFSDFKLCADEDCNAIMSHVKALRDYEAPDCRYLSFKAKQRIQVFMKLTGESDSLWAGSCQGKIGFFPKDVVKEVQPFLNAKEIKFPSKERDFRCLDGEYVGEENDSSEDIEDNSAELDSAELAVGNPEVEEFIEDTSSEENIIGSGEDDILAERADLVKPPEKTSTGITATMQGLLSNTGGILGWFSGDKAPSQFETGPAAGDAAGPGDAADLLSHVGDDQQAPPGGNAELASAVAQSPRGDSGDSGAVSSTPGDVAAEHEHEVPTSGDEIAKVPPVPGGFLNNVQSLVSGFNFFGSKPTPDDKPAGTGGIVTSERSEETILKDRSPTSQPIDESQALVEASAPDKPPADASADLSNNANVEVITKDPQLPSAEPLADGNTLVLTEESNGGDISVSPDTSSTGDRGGKVDSTDGSFYNNAKWMFSGFGMFPNNKATGQTDGAKQQSSIDGNSPEYLSNVEITSEKAIPEDTAPTASEIMPVAGQSLKGHDYYVISEQDDALSQAENHTFESEVHDYVQIEKKLDDGNGGDSSSQQMQDLVVDTGDGKAAEMPLDGAENKSPQSRWFPGFLNHAQEVTKLFKRKTAKDKMSSDAKDMAAPGKVFETNGQGQPPQLATTGGMANEGDQNENTTLWPEPTPANSSQVQDGISQEEHILQVKSHMQNETEDTMDVAQDENGDLDGDPTSVDAVTTDSKDSANEEEGIILLEHQDIDNEKQDATLHHEKSDSDGLNVESDESVAVSDEKTEVGHGSDVSDDALLSTDSDCAKSIDEVTDGTRSEHDSASINDITLENDDNALVNERPPSPNEDRDRSNGLFEGQLSSESVTGDNASIVEDGSDLKPSEQPSLEEFSPSEDSLEESSLELNANQPFEYQSDYVDDSIDQGGTEPLPTQLEPEESSQDQIEVQQHATSTVEDTDVEKIALHRGEDAVESMFEMLPNVSQPEATQGEAKEILSFEQTEAATEGDGVGEASHVEETPIEQNKPEVDSSKILEGNVYEESTFKYHDGAAKDGGVHEDDTSLVDTSLQQALEPEHGLVDNMEYEHHEGLASKLDTADVESDGIDENETSPADELLQYPHETEIIPSDPREESDVELLKNYVESNGAEDGETFSGDETLQTWNENKETPSDQGTQVGDDPHEDLILHQEDNSLESDDIKEELHIKTPPNPLVTEDHIGESVNLKNDTIAEEVKNEDTMPSVEVVAHTVNEPEDDSRSLNVVYRNDFSDEPQELGSVADVDAENEHGIIDSAQFVPEPEMSGTTSQYANSNFDPGLTDPEMMASERIQLDEHVTSSQQDNADTSTVIGWREPTSDAEVMDYMGAGAGTVDVLIVSDQGNLAQKEPTVDAVKASYTSTGSIVGENDDTTSDAVAMEMQNQNDRSESEIIVAPVRDMGMVSERRTDDDLVPEVSVAENVDLIDTRSSQDAGDASQTLVTAEAEVLHGASQEQEDQPSDSSPTSGESQAMLEEQDIVKERSVTKLGNDAPIVASHRTKEQEPRLTNSEISESIAKVGRVHRSYVKAGLSESLDEPMLDVGVGSLPVPWLVSRLDHLLLRASTSVWPSLAPTVTLMVPDWVCPGGVKNVRQFTPLAMAALGALGVSSLLLGFVFRLCSVIKNRRCLSREAKLMCQVAALLQEKSALALEISNCTQKLAAKQDAEEEPLRQAGSSGHVAELRESNAELRRLVAELRSAASQVTAALSDVRSEHRGRLDQASPTRDEEDEEDEEGGENEDLGSKLVEAEHLLAAALSRVDVLAATLQTSIQSRDSLLEVEELRRCREEVAALRRGLEEARSTQAALDTTLAARCSEHQMMSEGLQQLELLGGSALGADGPGGSYPVWASSEHHATNAVLMKATIERVEGETLRLGEQLLSEERATQELRERASALRRECAAVRQDEEQGRRGAEALRVRLQLLTDMHRGTDASLKRELSEKENSGQTKASACSEAEQKALQAMEEATQYKQRVSDLKRELRQTEDSFREQISTQEKDIHEQWFAACKAKRELVEVRKEMSVLQRLSEVKGSATQLVHPTPSRPPTGPPLGAFPPEPTSGLVPDRRRSLPSPGPPQHRGPQHHGSNSSLASSCSLDVDNDGRLAVAPPRRPSSHCGAPLSPPPTLGGSFTEPSPFRPRRGGPLSPLFGAPRWCPAAPWGPLSPPGSDMGPRRNLSPLMDPRMLLPSLPPAAAPLPPPHRGFAQPPRAFPPARSPAPLYGPAPPYDPRHVPCIQGRANQAEGARSQAMSPPPPGPPRKASTPK
ncbi:transport and Golgi organization protein 1 homolog isoform X3 [Lethenteron reissneri]|uniref:transport and Golgi organization protein 1 homolog isoform X3 n=1 Tax=Lethenteron reissneri TaxID=7753 RepID=UPI002AB7322C|nr:transport and Golgi organization protein 1 homolog isoform X3 [Lethenteron reissneri]